MSGMSPSTRPFLLAIAGIGILCVMDALLKAVGARYPTFQLAFLRFLVGVLWAGLAVLIMRPAFPSRETIRLNAVRGCIGVVTATSFFYALQTLPLAEAIAFSFLSPLFLALFGALILGEVIGRHTALGLLFGFAGMIVMTFGNGIVTGQVEFGQGLHLPGVGAAVVSAFCYALGLVLLRQRAQQDALVIIVFFQMAVPSVLMIVPAWLVWVPLQPGDLALFLAIGGLGLAGHLLMAMAFKRAEAARLAPAEYSALIFASALGIIYFAEVPGLATLIGASLVIMGTVLAMRSRSTTTSDPS
ncbi:RhaT Permeases of the drug/metabolite transporter (DMT) superfamily [Rhabdaerophilaceae bacterium]